MATKIWLDGKKIVATILGMGRKRLPDDERREKPLRVRLTAAERSEVDAAAQAQELTTSEWARQTMLDSARKSSRKRK